MHPILLPLAAALTLLISFPSRSLAQTTPTPPPPAAAVERSDPGHPGSILVGLTTVVAPGTPGALAVWGPEAVPLIAGKVQNDLRVPVVAAGPFGRGRVIALAHTWLLDLDSLKIGDTRAFLTAAIRWAAQTPDDPRTAHHPIRIGLLRCNLAPFITELGFTPVQIEPAQLEARLAEQAFDAICLVGPQLSEPQQKALAEFAASGGGLIAAQTAWAWPARPDQSITDNPLNRVFARAGIAWTDGTSERTQPAGFTVNPAPPLSLHAAFAINELLALGKLPLKPDAHARQLSRTATDAARVLPPGDTLLRPRLEQLLTGRDAGAIPTPDRPLRPDRPIDRLLVALELADLQQADPSATRAHPSAAAFPGAVPKEAPRVERTVSIDLAIPEWHSTGLYAAPGELITIRVPAGTDPKLVSIRIGCHKDELWHLDAWRRMPEITRHWPLTGETTTVASPFGGPVYIVVNRKPEQATGTLDVAIAGGVEAPLFILDQTTLADWRDHLRARPAPWAELVTDKIILSVPSEHIRDLDNPEALLRYWNRLADAQDEVCGITTAQRVGRPERFVADIQISAGYMHSGYPIMTHLDAAPKMVDLDHLQRGDWGLLHELGHNHQRPEWTFRGTGEVTNNVLVLYTLQTICNRPWDEVHASLKNRDEKIAAHLAAGARFDKWQSDPFLALQMYAQLVEGFGWDVFKRVFAEYRDLPDAERPKSEDDKRDQWLIRFSRACGRDLGPFFVAWGVPTSDAARASIADLPDWFPPNFPPAATPATPASAAP